MVRPLFDQEPGQFGDRDRVVVFQVERLAQRRLIVGVSQIVGLGSGWGKPIDPFANLRLGNSPDELVDHLALRNGEDRWD